MGLPSVLAVLLTALALLAVHQVAEGHGTHTGVGVPSVHTQPSATELTVDASTSGLTADLTTGLPSAVTSAPDRDGQLPDAAACVSVLVTALLLLHRRPAGLGAGPAPPRVAAGPAPTQLGRSSRQLLTAISVLRI